MNDQDQTLSEFKRLLWEGRKIQFRASKKEEAREPLEQAAQYADDHGLSAEAGIARASLLQMEEKYDDALAAIEEAQNNPDILLPGIAWHVKGTILRHKKAYDQAIECYQKALASPGYDTPGDAWFNMGNSLYEEAQQLGQSKPQEALEKLNQSLGAYREAMPHLANPEDAKQNIAVNRELAQQLIEMMKQQPPQDQKQDQNKDQNNKKNLNQEKIIITIY